MGLPVPSPVARGVGRLLAARLDPAVVLIPGRGRLPIFDGRPAGARPVEAGDDGACPLAVVDPGLPGGLPPVDESFADLLHLRGYAQPDRAGIHVLVRFGVLLDARPGDRA